LQDEIDPNQRLYLDRLQEEYQRLHGAAVDLIKAEVGPGEEYSNTAGRAVISPNGAWFECFDLPMEFSGAAGGPVSYGFVSDAEAMALLEQLRSKAEEQSASASSRFGLFVLYTRRGIAELRDAYVVRSLGDNEEPGRRSPTSGSFRSGVLPLLFRARIAVEEDIPGLSFRRGVVFCLAGIGERNLVVEISYESPEVRDLSVIQPNQFAQ
jgi:hypothetical protein